MFFQTHSCTVLKATKIRKNDISETQIMGTKLTLSLNIFFHYEINIFKIYG